VNLLLLLEMASAVDPGRVAFRSGDAELTAGQLSELCPNIGAALGKGGFTYLAYGATNSLAFPVAVFAAAAAGIPLVPMNYRLSEDRREATLARHAGALVVAEESQLPSLLAAGHKAVSPDRFLDMGAVTADKVAEPCPEDIAVLLYTSGTTSEPKAVVLRHRHLTSYVISTVEYGSSAPTDAALVAVPPYHIAGVTHVLSNLYAGRQVIYLDAFDAEEWLALVRDQGVTHAMVVPTMLARIVESLDGSGRPAPPTLTSLVYGGAAMPGAVLTRALRSFPNVGFVNAYGLTETASTIALLGPEDHRRALDDPDPSVRDRLRSTGRVVPGIEVEVRAADGTVLGASTVGEIYVRGSQVSGEYVSADPSLDTDGWFATRDIGYLDGEGYLFIDGRSDDTIIRGGENIAPVEIEEVLLLHPDVSECAVVGINDDDWGQRTVAVIVPRETADPLPDELRQWVRDRLRGSRTPDQVEFRSELPYTETGKLMRRNLRTELESVETTIGRH
jgi:acyl-CoA synthetase (AMP-forming)/AMP-acid ligase II